MQQESQILNRQFRKAHGLSSSLVYSMLRKKQVSETFHEDKALEQVAKRIFTKFERSSGFVEELSRGNRRSVITGSGYANLNPAIVSVELFPTTKGTKIVLTAYAKEGLISQKTAPKALKRFKEKVI